jgi:hypothetical protein
MSDLKLLLVLFAITGCDASSNCLLNVNCIADIDCPNGSRCDTGRANPVCTRIHCGQTDFACSGDDQCATGLQCHKSLCTRCDVCGDQCEVDFETSSTNCGACGNVCPDWEGKLSGCVHRVCEGWAQSRDRLSCNDVCTQYGLVCSEPGKKHADYVSDLSGRVAADISRCDLAPPPELASIPFYQVVCTCLPAS